MIIEIINLESTQPYELGVGFGGRRGYDPKTIMAIIAMKHLLKETLRGMVGHLEDSKEMCSILNLSKIPKKNTLNRAYTRISPKYMTKINRMITAEIDVGNVATDSSGFSKRLHELWSTIKKSEGLRKGYLKLHTLVDIGTRVIIDFKVTNSNVADITVFREFLERFDWSKTTGGTICADAAYLAREICTSIEKLGYAPRIMPKSNTIANAKGHMAWRNMILFYENAYKEFIKEYGQRSIVESVFGALKRVYGNSLNMYRRDHQEIELAMDVLCYNASYMCRHRFSNMGGVYPEQQTSQQNQKHNRDMESDIKPEPPPLQWTDATSSRYVSNTISKLIENGILQISKEHDKDEMHDVLKSMTNSDESLLFYPPGSQQRDAALAAAEYFDKYEDASSRKAAASSVAAA